MMEGAAEVNEEMEDSAEAPCIKRKEHDQPQQQLESRDGLESPAPVMTIDSEWREHLTLLRSSEPFVEAHAGRSLNYHPGSQSGPDSSPRPSNCPDVMVEELTVKNYKNPNQSLGGCSSSGGESPIRRDLWQNFRRLAGGSRDAPRNGSLTIGDRENLNSSFLPQLWAQDQQPNAQVEPNYTKVSDNLAGSDNHTVVSNSQARVSNGIRTKVIPASGFQQFLMRNTLKGKGLEHRQEGLEDASGTGIQSRINERCISKVNKGSDPSHEVCAKADGGSLLGGGISGALEIHHDGIYMREWLKSKHRNVCKIERLQIFKKIVEHVDSLHSKGFVLQHLRPSYIMMLSSGKVKYVGSLQPLGQVEQSPYPLNQNMNYLDHHLKGKRSLKWGDDISDIIVKHRKVCEHNHDAVKHHIFTVGIGSKGVLGEADFSRFKEENSGYDFKEQWKQGDEYKRNNSGSSFRPYAGSQQSTHEFLKLEERWYSSPEQLSEGVCSFSSNIYSLGVLLFELFCSFESWEVHSAAMSDLHHRILHPKFLSENPKEAGFCLWLLHPDPSSRPNSRDILLHNLICESRDLSALDQSSALLDEEDAEAELLLSFLLSLKEQKEMQAAKLGAGLGCLKADIEEVERRQPSRTEFVHTVGGLQTSSTVASATQMYKGPKFVGPMSRLSMPNMNEERLMRNIEQLENAYFSMRSEVNQSEISIAARSDIDVLKIRNGWSRVQNEPDVLCENKGSTDRLGDFFEGLCKFARFSKFEVCGTLRNVDILNSANVICSLSFDRDEDYFACAGVSKKIKIFEFGALLSDAVDIHYPVVEMSSRSKLSYVSWNSYIKNYLASTDYEGVVQLWDASTGQGFRRYTEHQKRAWSVDFSQVDPTKLASGSDDCSVKLWSINEKNCIDTIRNVANVCCVQFSPHSSHLLAFGSAGYKVYCYDLRNTRIPWCTLAAHGRAVSYVKFVDHETLVSASTDNTLKLWDLNKTNSSGLSTSACSLTLSGHTNEKNFVGLSVFDGYVACGSETNEVYAYYNTLPMPITSHKFGSIDPITGQETSDHNGQFVSSVCWRGKSSMVVAANSSGSIKVLQLV